MSVVAADCLSGDSRRLVLAASTKYDFGACTAQMDITRPELMPPDVLKRFAGARGLYATLEPGDVLFIPTGGWWHAVVSSQPSISLGMFGLSLWEVLTRGPGMILTFCMHKLGLYRRGYCTCCRNTGV